MRVSTPTATRAAYAAAALNLCAAVAMVVGMRPGLPAPGTDPAARLAYISHYSGAWISGWLLWHAAAISLLALYVALGSRWQERSPLAARMAPLLAAAGLGGRGAGGPRA